MSKPTNSDEFEAAMARTQARKDAEDSLPDQDKAFLKALQNRWFPMGKTEDFALVKRLFLETRGQG
jgi:hypothetical protein